MAAISGWYLVLLIPSALLVLLVWMLSRQKWGAPKGDGTKADGRAAAPERDDPTS